MKNKLFIYALILLSSIMLHTVAVGQDQPYKARLSVDYYKIMGDKSFIKTAVKYKGENGYEPGTMLPLTIYKELEEDSLIFVGKCVTNMKGVAEFDVEFEAIPDSLVKYVYVVKIENNELLKDADKSISFFDVDLTAETIIEDSIHHILAKLVDALGAPIKGVKMETNVHRLFGPLKIGESSYRTDKSGTILVPFEEPLPGIDGNLTFEVMLDSKKYGIVSVVFEAPLGTPIVDQSTFDQRTMWSPPTKTPLFLWIFPNLVILGIWIVIFVLLKNLFKIYKS